MYKMLTLEQLVKFCEYNKMYNFSADDSGYKLCVQVPSKFESFNEKSTDSMMYGKVKLLHTNTNRNRSNVTYDAAKNCMSSIKYKPLLANFCEIDGVKDFTSHDIEINENGETEYIEHQIGCFTVDEPYMEYDEDKDRHYIYAYVAIPREYTAAAEIIDRKGGTKISAELAINKMSYDARSKELILEDIEVMGATCLGKNPENGEDLQEGMEGARLDITDFSASKNSVKFEQNDKLIETLEKLNDTLTELNINTKDSVKGGNNQVNLFDELLNKYEKSIEDITFEYEGLSDEELVAAFAEAFAEPKKKIEDDDSVVQTPDDSDSNDGDVQTNADQEPEEDEPEEQEENAPESNEDEPEENGETDPSLNSASFSIGTKTYSVSLSDIMYALCELVNDTYADECSYYSVEVYADDSYVIMQDWYTGKAYKQNFKCKKKCSYSLVGDRVPVKAIYVTEDEEKELDKIRSNYSSIESKLAKYEEEPEKIKILESEEYSSINDKAEFEELKVFENHFDLSIDELKAKADDIILQYAKAGQLTFASSESVGNKRFTTQTKPTKRSRYGGLGKKEN